jgi:dCTP deaminase
MVVNGDPLLMLSPIKDMESGKCRQYGVSHGLAEVGYDIRIKQEVLFIPGRVYAFTGAEYKNAEQLESIEFQRVLTSPEIFVFDGDQAEHHYGNFTLASAIEEFVMPPNLVGIVHDKSTWARQGLSVFNTVIEPGWRGFLTLELAFRGQEPVHIPAGAGIAQVLFHETSVASIYDGKYQDQADFPVESVYA